MIIITDPHKPILTKQLHLQGVGQGCNAAKHKISVCGWGAELRSVRLPAGRNFTDAKAREVLFCQDPNILAQILIAFEHAIL